MRSNQICPRSDWEWERDCSGIYEFMQGHKTVRMNKNSHWSEHTDPITMVEGVSVSRVQLITQDFLCALVNHFIELR